ncbi:GTPase IMAP family member 8-like [Megalops cyprinoides]|uniref:GTPase IMAP family member 8-like n=1 Tax=Megalops cyprinoides TaxID=118141 RepID=UPI001863DBBE|nr:GTPase IMAP family member 8-like [Megalops cyprinoides]
MERNKLPSFSLTEETSLSDLRIVLLGGRWTGKSSAGDTILGREEFESGKRTVQCVKRQGEVAGRQFTVVDTPGWWDHFSIKGSADLLKQEIMSSVSLCPPGPHAFLIVINADSSFEEKHRKSMEEHLHQLLGEGVWRHSILLFISGNHLGEKPMKQHSETERKALQWVKEKCGNRYHDLCNKNRDDVTQVTELLEKIEEMVVGNGGREFHLETKVLQELEEKRKMIEERVTQRDVKVQKQREKLRDLLKELRIVLLGWMGGGKSSSGNTILGRQVFRVWRSATQCMKSQGEVAGRQVTVVDTPGWWKFIPADFTPDRIKQEIVNSLNVCPPGPHAILLVIRVDTAFKEEERIILRDNMKRLGRRVWRHTIVLFTWGECLRGTSIEHHIESEGKALQWVIEKCENRYHVFNNEDMEDRRQVTELLEKIEEMEAINSVFHLSAETHRDEMETDSSEDHLSTDTPKDPELKPEHPFSQEGRQQEPTPYK